MAVAGGYSTCVICKCEHCDLRQTGKCSDYECSTCKGVLWRWDDFSRTNHAYILNCPKFIPGIMTH